MKNSIQVALCLVVAGLVFWCGYSTGLNEGFFQGLDEGRRFVTCPDCDFDIPVLNPDGSAPTDDDIAKIYGETDPFK